MLIYRRFFKNLFLILLVCLFVSACSNPDSKKEISSMSSKSLKQDQRGFVNNTDASVKDQKKQPFEQLEASNRKLVKTAELQLETKKFDKTISALEKSVSSSSGYIESNHISGTSILEKYSSNNSEQSPSRTANYTVRVPSTNLNEFLNNLNKIGNVISKTVSTDDISNQYFDTETRMKSLKIQEDRLLNLLKKAGSLKDILEIEKQLTDVRYEIESLTTTLKSYDSAVNYSTINLFINEVSSITDTTPPKTIGDRIGVTFKQNVDAIVSGFKNTTVFLIGNSLMIIIWFAIIAVGYFITRKAIKKYQL
ncbi:DUF4349 domain-containing protein [Bacillus sp. AFS017336]|uniref:DUF4349 domain-containing protein n=1 Tax=Bacillus sp. AFS017336 TaxID=2033489 RepID=UPI000BF00829|nr:DUF4349 domain-containing protein [Bacillus sp. AFS017336]PEL07626.1 hypothetical protein CN601_19470 [Bacillus sp. AFS017336]